MSCLCAPTSHAGSFRCRLHRGSQQSWGGRPTTPAGSPSSPKPTSPTSPESGNSPTPVEVENGISKQVAHQLPTANRKCSVKYNPDFPVQKCSESRQSRLSRVSVASFLEAPSSKDQEEALSLSSVNAGQNDRPRALKLTALAASASSTMLEGGLVFFKKLQMGGKDTILDVFGSSTHLSRVEMSL